jgi:hypothetical protein
MTRKIPVTWTHQEVSVLTKLHGLFGDSPDGLHKTATSFERHTPADVRDKMIELELIAKPTKPTLDADQEAAIDADLTFCEWEEPQRTLAIRYAIKTLQEMLPKRAPKAVA